MQQECNFISLGLAPSLLKTLQKINFISPTPVQVQTIPLFLEGKDIIAQAQTGTGKTAAFALPIIQNLTNKSATQALIITPTRELAIQVADQFQQLSKLFSIAVLCGGQEYRPQLKLLKQGAQVVVGTPGRILDHIAKGSLKLNHLKTFILDEADEMLRMGFIDDVEAILSNLPNEKQIGLFSATMPIKIKKIAQKYLQDPYTIEIKAETATVKNIDQQFLFAAQNQKQSALLRILAVEVFQGLIIFVRTKSSAEELAAFLQQYNHNAMALHGDLTQSLREKIILQFRQGLLDILVATDVAARGLDVERVTHVINYDMPQDSETYIHRIGRTARAGRSGKAILFVLPREAQALNMIERHTKQKIQKINVPDDSSIQKAKINNFLENVKKRFTHQYLETYQKIINELIQEDGNPLQVAAAIALMFHKDQPWGSVLPKFSQSKQPSENKNSFHKKHNTKGRSNKHHYSSDQELFRLNVGRIHGVKPSNIVGAIANEAGLKSHHITNLKIHDDHSTVRLPKGMPIEIVQGLTKAWVCGRQLKLTSLEI